MLLILDRHGELTHRDMAGRCFITPATLTGVADTLEKGGYLRRTRASGDRRAVTLGITKLGSGLVKVIIEREQEARPLTSVDAHPANAAVIRAFLLELIENLSHRKEPG